MLAVREAATTLSGSFWALCLLHSIYINVFHIFLNFRSGAPLCVCVCVSVSVCLCVCLCVYICTHLSSFPPLYTMYACMQP